MFAVRPYASRVTDGGNRDSDRGLLLFRGYSLEQLWHAEFEDMLHLMVWGKYPTPSQQESLRLTLATLMTRIPRHVSEVIERFPYARL